jgi:two-component system chemotaxis response regulator CheY
MKKKNVLIVDDSLYMRTLIKDALVEGGYEVVGQASNGEQAIDLALSLNPDLVTLDNILPDMIGIDILQVLKEEGCEAKVIIVSAVGQQSVITEGFELGADDYIVKPFTTEKILGAADRVFSA